ncbi:aminotransferase class 3 [Talaromyces proteolyticus]|uniref:Aminotransferase class 3 n=1 Tax=Talaromyces proteolyticus TaxID=1131652 RepID=A0AAD4PZ41_9EURO|nr:aminotransferase class 3 [Talaromyces proteolyticus]KAH8695279.1 aminotransferase class 3 [Talaromyces proteolyticus]
MSSSRHYVDSALQKAHQTYQSRNPNSAKIHQDASQYLPGGNTRTSLYTQPFPLIITSARGSKLTSADGHSYTDFLSEYSAGVFGHSNAEIAQAVKDTLQRGWNYGAENVYEKQLARKIVDRFGPSGVELVRFTNSGTEANTVAIGAAIAWTGRKKVLVFSGAYHGSTFEFPMDFCRRWWQRHGFGSNKDGQQVYEMKTLNLPHEFVVAPFNNIAKTEHIIKEVAAHDNLAAILIEPVQGSGGCRPASVEFLRFLRDTADRLGALLVVDEVMTSRLSFSGYISSLGIKADLITFGKWIGGGMSFGAFGGRRDIMEMFNPARNAEEDKLIHPGTYNNNIFTMSAGVVGLDIFDAEKVRNLNLKGDTIKDGVTRILQDTDIYPRRQDRFLEDVIEFDDFDGDTHLYKGTNSQSRLAEGEPLPRMLISSSGSLLNVKFTGPNAEIWQGLYFHHMLERGVYIASRGFTPLNIELTDADVEIYISAARDFILQHQFELTR